MSTKEKKEQKIVSDAAKKKGKKKQKTVSVKINLGDAEGDPVPLKQTVLETVQGRKNLRSKARVIYVPVKDDANPSSIQDAEFVLKDGFHFYYPSAGGTNEQDDDADDEKDLKQEVPVKKTRKGKKSNGSLVVNFGIFQATARRFYGGTFNSMELASWTGLLNRLQGVTVNNVQTGNKSQVATGSVQGGMSQDNTKIESPKEILSTLQDILAKQKGTFDPKDFLKEAGQQLGQTDDDIIDMLTQLIEKEEAEVQR